MSKVIKFAIAEGIVKVRNQWNLPYLELVFAIWVYNKCFFSQRIVGGFWELQAF